jgi:hypothetical protein
MKLIFTRALAIVTFITVASLSSAAGAAQYDATRITNIVTNADGTMFIKWTGSPRPGSCGENFGWVKIRSTAHEAMKALALSIYFSGVPARIDTSGCDGAYEIVTALYTPSG